MTADQIKMILDVIAQAVATLGWVIGLSATVFLACFGGAVGLIFRQNTQRLSALEVGLDENRKELGRRKDDWSSASFHCAETRAKCREELLLKFVPEGDLKDMEREFKQMVAETLERLENQLTESRAALVKALAELRVEITGTVLNHSHENGGGVLFRRNGNR